MKRTNYFRNTLLQATFVASVLLISSCGANKKTENPGVVAEEHDEAKFDGNNHTQDALFLVNAAEINLEEIKLGELAQKNGRTTYVKELGKMMGAVHTKSLNDLTVLAKIKKMSIPASPTDHSQEAYKKLKDKSGADFDKAYAELMVSEHINVIATFEKVATEGNDTDIRNWAIVSLADLREHLAYSIDCQNICNELKFKTGY